MKVVTWNVNGLRAVHRNAALLPFIEKLCPDLLFLQEIKGYQAQFAKEVVEQAKYEIIYHSAEQAGYAGTGLWLRKNSSFKAKEFLHGMPAPAKRRTTAQAKPSMTTPKQLKGQVGDHEGRILGVRGVYKGIAMVFLGVYFPNGGKSAAAFEEKLVFYENFLHYVEEIARGGEVCFWGGDVNCAHTPIDLARPKENDGKVGFHPRERKWLDKVSAQQWIDIFRAVYPTKKKVYSWWSYRSGARENNVGWRIDYFFTKKSALPYVKKINYLPAVTGSDHCPLLLELHSTQK